MLNTSLCLHLLHVTVWFFLFFCGRRCQWFRQLSRSLELRDIQPSEGVHDARLGPGEAQQFALPPVRRKQTELAALDDVTQEQLQHFVKCVCVRTQKILSSILFILSSILTCYSPWLGRWFILTHLLTNVTFLSYPDLSPANLCDTVTLWHHWRSFQIRCVSDLVLLCFY